jgi:hypothetical protein
MRRTAGIIPTGPMTIIAGTAELKETQTTPKFWLSENG